MLEAQNVSNGCQQYEQYYDQSLQRNMVQYDYRHINGELFSCVKLNLPACIAARDRWLEQHGYTITSVHMMGAMQ